MDTASNTSQRKEKDLEYILYFLFHVTSLYVILTNTFNIIFTAVVRSINVTSPRRRWQASVPLILSSRPLQESAAPLGSSHNLQFKLVFTLMQCSFGGCSSYWNPYSDVLIVSARLYWHILVCGWWTVRRNSVWIRKNQLDVTFCILYFSSTSCSTCSGQPCAHHQELTTAWCYSLVLVCAVAAGRLSRPVGR